MTIEDLFRAPVAAFITTTAPRAPAEVVTNSWPLFTTAADASSKSSFGFDMTRTKVAACGGVDEGVVVVVLEPPSLSCLWL